MCYTPSRPAPWAEELGRGWIGRLKGGPFPPVAATAPGKRSFLAECIEDLNQGLFIRKKEKQILLGNPGGSAIGEIRAGVPGKGISSRGCVIK